MSGVPESMEMSLFGPLFDRSGKYLDYLVPKSRGFWPEGEKGGQKRGPKMGHFGGSPNLSKPSKMMKFPCFWSKFHVFEVIDPKMSKFGSFLLIFGQNGIFWNKNGLQANAKIWVFSIWSFWTHWKKLPFLHAWKTHKYSVFPEMAKNDQIGWFWTPQKMNFRGKVATWGVGF